MRRLAFGGILLALFVLLGCSVGPQEYDVYVPNAGDGTITVYNTLTQQIKQTIKVGETASHGVAVTPDNKYLYTGDLDGGNVYVIDTTSGKKIKTIEVGERTHGIDISPDGKYVLFAAGRSGGPILAIIDTKTNEIVSTVTQKLEGPTHMSFSPDGKKAYIADPVANKVIELDMEDLSTVCAWETGSEGAQETTTSPDGKNLYVANYEGETVSVIDTGTGKVKSAFVTGKDTHAVAVSPDGQFLWVVVQGEAKVKIYDIANNYELVQSIDNMQLPNHIRFTPDGTKAFITERQNNQVHVFDANNFEELSQYQVGISPHEIDFVAIK